MKRILLSSFAVFLFAAPVFAQTDGNSSRPTGSVAAATSPASTTSKNKQAQQAQSSSTVSQPDATTPVSSTVSSSESPSSSAESLLASTRVASSMLSSQPLGLTTASQISQDTSSPLSFRIGGADFTPLGFLDMTGVFRSTDVGSGIGTSFGGIPFNASSPAGQLSELRFSAQNSRIGLRVDSEPGDFKVRGYIEADFLGNAAANLEVGSHSDTLRMRLYWVDLHKGKIEILAGQSWSMMTPNRVGISPVPGDIFYTQDMDTNYQVGLVWLRTPGFRLVFHPNDHVAWGFALEDPEQYTGGLTTFPTAFTTALQAQVDDSGGNSKTPNKAPDIMSKLAFDTHPNGGGRNFHIEVAGLYRAFRLNTPGLGNVTNSGGGGSINANLELAKNFHLIANTFWSDGGGRYIFQLGPDFVVNVNGAGNFIPSPVHAGSGIGGFEYTIKNSLLYAYYGGAYFGRDFQATTGTGGTTYTGYGYPGSGSSQNRTIQEPTIGLIQTFWKNPNYGDLKLISQVSYLSRNPWSVTGTPGNAASAHLGMAYVDLRYDLP